MRPTVRLERIIIENFKSFRGRVEIPIREGLTAISGPNGSGKSNLVDALMFVLGAAGPRAMRAERLEDLVHRSPGAVPRKAHVAITLSVTRGKRVQRVEVEREAARTRGEWTSTYRLAGKEVRRGELERGLEDLGLARGASSAVLQGDVIRVVSMGAVERRRIIDELAGVSRLDERIAEARAEMEKADEHTRLLRLHAQELSKRVAECGAEREHALEVRSLEEEAGALECELRAAEVLRLVERRDGTSAELARLVEESQEAEQRKGELEERLGELKEQLLALDALLRELGETERASLLAEVEVRHREREGVEQEMARVEVRVREIAARREALYLEKETLSGKRQAAAQDLAEAEAGLDEALALERDAEGALSWLRRETERGMVGQKEAMERFMETRRGLLLEEASRDRLLGMRSDLLVERTGVDKEQELCARAIAELSERVALVSAAHDERETSLLEVVAQADLVQAKLDDARAALRASRDEVSRQESTHRRAFEALLEAEAVLDRGKDGQPRAVRAVLEQGFPGVRGVVQDLIVLPEPHGLALEVAAGARLHGIVVEKDRDAARAIRFLTEQRIGRATFLPLDCIRPPADPGRIRFDGFVGHALDLVLCEPDLVAVAGWVFGGTLVVETLEHARPQIGRHRMVTRTGELLERNGAIVGGFLARRAADVASRQETLACAEAELGSARERTAGLEAQADELASNLRALGADKMRLALERDHAAEDRRSITELLARHQARLVALEEQFVVARHRVDEVSEELSCVAVRVTSFEASLGALEATIDFERGAPLRQAVVTRERRVTSVRARVRQAQSSRDGRAQKLAEIGSREEALAGDVERILAEERDAAGLRVELAERESSLGGRLAEARNRLNELGTVLSARNEERRATAAEMDRLQRGITEAATAMGRLQADRERTRWELLAVEEALSRLAAEPALERRGLEGSRGPAADPETLRARMAEVKAALVAAGPANMLAIEKYDCLAKEHAELEERMQTLARERRTLVKRIATLEERKRDVFEEAFRSIDEHFRAIYGELTGGEARLDLERPDAPFDGGLVLRARPRGKQVKGLRALSGGEKSLAALAFTLACQRYHKAPFYLLDEVDMFLDARNTAGLSALLRRSSDEAQFLVVSLRGVMLERAHQVVGLVAQEGGSTAATGVSMAPRGAGP